MSNDHEHEHDDHAHDKAWRELAPTPGWASMLDIGGDVGAAIVELTADTPTGELMACHRGRPDDHFHTGVHLRSAGDTTAWVAVFPEIVEGAYSLLTDDGHEHMPFVVVGGQVTSLVLTLTLSA